MRHRTISYHWLPESGIEESRPMHDPQANPAADDDAAFVLRMALGGDGPRVGVKDSIDIAGYPTRAGRAAFADAGGAQHHAAVVQSLLDGGCRIVGKTNMHE